MNRFGIATLAAVALAAPALPAADKGRDGLPAVVVQVKSLNDLIADAKHIGKLFKPDGSPADNLETMLSGFLGQDWNQAVDATKPVGLYVNVPADVTASSAVLLAPVADKGKFLKLLEAQGMKATEEKDGVYAFTPPGLPLPAFFKFSAGYAYVTVKDTEAIKGKLPAPGEILPADKAVASVKLNIDRVPKELRQLAATQIEQLIEAVPAQGEAAAASMKQSVDQIKSLVLDGEEFAVKFAFDRATNDAAFEFDLSGQPNTKLAKTLAKYGANLDKPSVVGGVVGKDSVFDVVMNLPSDNSVQGLDAGDLADALHQGLAGVGIEIPEEKLKPLGQALLDSATGDVTDFAVSLRAPGADKHFSAVAGLRVKKGSALEGAVKNFVKELPEDKRKLFKIDAGKVGGTAYHEVKIPTDKMEKPEEFKKAFGDAPALLAFREDALFVTLGGGTKLLEEALAVKPTAVPQLEVHFTPKNLAKAIRLNKEDEADAKAVESAFGADAGKPAKLFYGRYEPGAKLKMRLGVDLGVFAKIAKVMDKKKAD